MLVLTMVSCGQSNNKKVDLEKITQLGDLAEIDSLSLFLGLPTIVKLFDNKLFIVDMFDEGKIVKIYDLEKKEILLSFAKKGEGPYEYLHVNNIDIYRNSDSRVKISLFDPVSSKLGVYDYDSLLIMNNNYLPKMILSKNKDVRFHEILRINEGYLATGLTTEGKYTLLSDSLKIIGYFGKYRPKPQAGISGMSHIIANYGKSVLSRNKDLLIEIIYNASVLSCYDVKKTGITQRWESVIHELDYRMDGTSIINNAPIGYLSAYIGDDKIYALYSGEADDMDAVATYGKEIHVYSYTGNIIGRYSISKPAFAFCIDEKADKIYVLSHVPEPNITVYDMN